MYKKKRGYGLVRQIYFFGNLPHVASWNHPWLAKVGIKFPLKSTPHIMLVKFVPFHAPCVFLTLALNPQQTKYQTYIALHDPNL